MEDSFALVPEALIIVAATAFIGDAIPALFGLGIQLFAQGSRKNNFPF